MKEKRTRREWTKEEIDFIIENYDKKLVKDIAITLNRNPNTLNHKILRDIKKFFSEESIKKHKELSANAKSNANFGEKNPAWKSGKYTSSLLYERTKRKKFPEHMNARKKVQTAVRTGKLQRQPCEICGEKKAEAHHDDYSKPLEIRWLCKKHHSEYHKNKRSLSFAANAEATVYNDLGRV